MKTNDRRLFITLAVVAALMFGVAFAAAPLYRLYCSVTGYGGATRKAGGEENAVKPIDRWMTIRFNADTDPKLPWKFTPDQKELRVRVGESSLASFTAENLTGENITGMATYNVTPDKVGEYFVKVQCFCFDLQTLTPHQKVSMPVSFFVDPALANDNNLDDVKTITLSYTFFRSTDG